MNTLIAMAVLSLLVISSAADGRSSLMEPGGVKDPPQKIPSSVGPGDTSGPKNTGPHGESTIQSPSAKLPGQDKPGNDNSQSIPHDQAQGGGAIKPDPQSNGNIPQRPPGDDGRSSIGGDDGPTGNRKRDTTPDGGSNRGRIGDKDKQGSVDDHGPQSSAPRPGDDDDVKGGRDADVGDKAGDKQSPKDNPAGVSGPLVNADQGKKAEDNKGKNQDSPRKPIKPRA
ncbi:hypothetical protein KP509_01G045900 [Ceratopteris richardii]|uniref:Uncharacterized protein n=1 Tax=Ceratopteris richardii TaxID=49495 RepID=A0A8T2VCN9_CERRI|nr:hypothetical protein KP509_01G045900 [Ceratopteris richardii]